MRLLLDETLSPWHAQTLSSLGHDAVSVLDLGLGGAEDSDVRTAAIGSGRILVTLDGDFANVLRYPPAGTTGIIRLRLHPATEAAIETAIRWAVSRLGDTGISGKLVVVDAKRIRIRS